MARPVDGDRYLKIRDGWYYYYRHVPVRLRSFYESGLIRIALGTRSAEVARMRRDGLAEADAAYWSDLNLSLQLERAGEPMDTAHARRRYELAKARAMAAGFTYRRTEELTDPRLLAELVERTFVLRDQASSDGRLNPVVAEAVLGGVDEPKDTISDAMELYQTRIAVGELRSKSPQQRKLWKATKDRSLRYFIDVIGDIPIADITREHAQEYFRWWNDQLDPADPDEKPKKPKTASRHFGDIRNLYSEYFRYRGEEDRPNPFRDLNIKGKSRTTRPPIDDAWVLGKILVPGALDGLTDDIVLSVLMIIETGCRPGEIINLLPDDIRLSDRVPHIRIRPVDEDGVQREIKTESSIREIPLIGVSLEAARRAPEGFAKYRDRTNSYSAAANKALRRRGLFPTKSHVIYSFRHAFEKRMQEANIDYGLRCVLMGHEDDRPKYGDGGSLEYRRRELLKIAHPFPNDFFAAFDSGRAAA